MLVIHRTTDLPDGVLLAYSDSHGDAILCVRAELLGQAEADTLAGLVNMRDTCRVPSARTAGRRPVAGASWGR